MWESGDKLPQSDRAGGSQFDPGEREQFEGFWDAFLPDDLVDPLPERGDFWLEPDDLRGPDT